MCSYDFLFCQILKILQFFQYTKFYKTIENVSFALYHRIYLLAPLISMRLLILKILCWVESLISIFNFLCKSAVFIYYPVYLSFLLSKKILSCSLRYIKFLVLCTLRLITLFVTHLFYFKVLFLL